MADINTNISMVDAVMRMQHYIAEHIKEPITQHQPAPMGYRGYIEGRPVREANKYEKG